MKKWKRLALAVSGLFIITGALNVHAGEYEDALRAYADFVRSDAFFSAFSLFDINGDGVPELKVSGSIGYGFYTFFGGQVQDAGFAGKALLEACWPETGLVRYFRGYKQGYAWTQYYVLEGGRLQKLCFDTDGVEFEDGWGNSISEQEYYDILEQYQVGSWYEPFTEWHDITPENINTYLNPGNNGSGEDYTAYGSETSVSGNGGYETNSFNGEYLLPQSSTRYLTEDDIAGFSLQELCYARNEIAARYGRKFVSPELTQYFSTRSWYVPTMEADYYNSLLPGLLNEYENWNSEWLLSQEKNSAHPNGYALDQSGYDITNVRTFWGTYAQPQGDITDPSLGNDIPQIKTEIGQFSSCKGSSGTQDLNGDGISESITLSIRDDGSWNVPCQVTVNGISSEIIYCENPAQEFYLVSFDGRRVYIVIYDEGPSDDPLSTFFLYTGSEILTAGQIDDYPSGMSWDGSNIISRRKCHLFSTFGYYMKWGIGENGMIYEAAQDYYNADTTYPSNISNKALVPVVLYTERDTGAASFYMDPQEFTIKATDGVRWVYLVGTDGITEGWFNAGDYDNLNGLFQLAWAD
ncbi:MAG: YARHG domain-containing protein [Blautia sp.]|nr:YARHG domain-containing protein [Blautia sp.]